MDNIKISEIEVPTSTGTEIHILIDKGNGEFITMTKAYWDEQQAQQNQYQGVTTND